MTSGRASARSSCCTRSGRRSAGERERGIDDPRSGPSAERSDDADAGGARRARVRRRAHGRRDGLGSRTRRGATSRRPSRWPTCSGCSGCSNGKARSTTPRMSRATYARSARGSARAARLARAVIAPCRSSRHSSTTCTGGPGDAPRTGAPARARSARARSARRRGRAAPRRRAARRGFVRSPAHRARRCPLDLSDDERRLVALLERVREVVLSQPAVGHAITSFLVAEGRRFATTDDGARWLERPARRARGRAPAPDLGSDHAQRLRRRAATPAVSPMRGSTWSRTSRRSAVWTASSAALLPEGLA